MRNEIKVIREPGQLVDREHPGFKLPAGHTGLNMNLGEAELVEGNPGKAYIESLAPTSQKTMKSYLNWSARHLIQRHNDLEEERAGSAGQFYDIYDFVGKEGNPLDLYATFSWNQLNRTVVSYLYAQRQKTYVTVPRSGGREFKQPSNSMLRSLLAALRGVAREAVVCGWISQHEELLISRLKGPSESKDQKPQRHILSDSDIRKLIRTTAEAEKPHGTRDAALLCLLLGMGLRREEAGAIQHDGIRYSKNSRNSDKEYMLVSFVGKGDKPAVLPVPEWAAPYLQKWFDWRDLSIEGPVFNPISRHEEIYRSRGLTGEGVAWILEKRLAEAGLNQNVRPHDLRRTFAMRKLESGMDIISIQKLMRHSDVKTTQRYLDHIKEAELHHKAAKDDLVI